MENSFDLTPHRIVEHDPLARRLGRHVEPLRFALSGLILGVLQTLVFPFLAGVLQQGSAVDWPNLVVMLVLIPLILGWYAWQPRAILKVYEGLLARLTAPQQKNVNPANTLLAPHKFGAYTWLVLAASITATVVLAWRLLSGGEPSWENATVPLILLRLIIRFLAFYTLLMFLVRQIQVSVSINRFFQRFRATLNPLHPDESGGLRVLGTYALNSAGLVMVVGMVLSLQYLSARSADLPVGPEFPAEVLIYLVAGPAVFFIPLLESHRQMVSARNTLLAEIAEEFEHLYQEIKHRLAKNEEMADALVQLEAVEDLYNVVARAPSWPFNAPILSRFGGLIAVPILIPAIAEIIVDLMR
jgi:hypothetical protein